MHPAALPLAQPVGRAWRIWLVAGSVSCGVMRSKRWVSARKTQTLKEGQFWRRFGTDCRRFSVSPVPVDMPERRRVGVAALVCKPQRPVVRCRRSRDLQRFLPQTVLAINARGKNEGQGAGLFAGASHSDGDARAEREGRFS